MATKGEDVLMRLWVGMSLAAVALAAAGCGGGGGAGQKTTATTSSTAEAKLVLASAPQKVKDANSSKFSYSITVDSEQLSAPITIPGDGEFDYANKEGRLTMDYGQVLSAAGRSGNGEMEIIAK